MEKTIVILLTMLFSSTAFGAHPLVTDDTGTQSTGNYQLEFNGEYAHDSSDSTTEIAAAVSGGISDDIDLVVSAPWQSLRSQDDDGVKVTEEGLSDAALEMKWRFYEKDGLGFAVKPGITFPTGDDEKGLGDGKAAYGLTFIATAEFGGATCHANLGFTKNRKELRDIWSYSAAVEYEFMDGLVLAGNIGGETNSDKETNTHPAFVLGGLIYAVNSSLNIDFGVKAGLNSAEPDYTVLAGLAYMFGGDE